MSSGFRKVEGNKFDTHQGFFSHACNDFCFKALFTRDDDTSDEEEEDDSEKPDMIAADELQSGGVSEVPSSKQR